MSNTLLDTRLLTYNSVAINGVELDGTNCRASYNSPFNRIDVTVTPKNSSIDYYEVRVTRYDEPYDIGVGGRVAYWNTNIAGNTSHSFSININSETFPLTESEYKKQLITFRLGFYARGVDGKWDVVYILLTIDGEQLSLTDGNILGVLTDRDIPSE